MPGGFTHFGLVKMLCINKTLSSIDGISEDIRDAILEYQGYVDLGAVSPDLPYLGLASGSWADAFHHQETVNVIRVGIRKLQHFNQQNRVREKLIAWLFGYASHAVADMIAHPVVAMKVGAYEQNKTGHRVCEMHQDAYIFSNYFGDSISACEYLDNGIKTCTDDGRPGSTLATCLRDFWTEVLKEVYPEKTDPEPASWYSDFVRVMDLAEENWACLVFRGLLEHAGLAYPKQPDVTYINDLPSPSGQPVTFDELFKRFQSETKTVWGEMGRAITNVDPNLVMLPNGDFDTGLALETGKSVFWRTENGIA